MTELANMTKTPLRSHHRRQGREPDQEGIAQRTDEPRRPCAGQAERDGAFRDDPDALPVTDNSSLLTPTLQEVIDGLTALEEAVLVAHLDAGMECNGAETLDAMRADNMTWSDVAETSKRTG